MSPAKEKTGSTEQKLDLLLAKVDRLLRQEDVKDKVFTAKEAAEYTKLHENTVKNRAKELGINPNGKRGRKYTYSYEDVEKIRLYDSAVNNMARRR